MSSGTHLQTHLMWVIFAYTLSEVYYSAQCFEKWRIGCYRCDKTYLIFVICYIGVVISGNAQDVTLCPLIMISINFFSCGTAVLLGLGHLIV